MRDLVLLECAHIHLPIEAHDQEVASVIAAVNSVGHTLPNEFLPILYEALELQKMAYYLYGTFTWVDLNSAFVRPLWVARHCGGEWVRLVWVPLPEYWVITTDANCLEVPCFRNDFKTQI